jgi:hypothetical protein
MSPNVTEKSAFKHGSLGKQVLLAIVTLGMYNLYWFYQASEQLANGTDADIDPTMVTILILVPFYGMWNFCNYADAVTDQDSTVLFLLFLFTGVGGWYLVQSGINDTAGS